MQKVHILVLWVFALTAMEQGAALEGPLLLRTSAGAAPIATSSLWNARSPIRQLIPEHPKIVLDCGKGALRDLPGIGLNTHGWAVALFDARGKSWSRTTLRGAGNWIIDNVPVPDQLTAYNDAMAALGDDERHLVVVDVDRIFNIYGTRLQGEKWIMEAAGVLHAAGMSHGFRNNNRGPWLGSAAGFCSASGIVLKQELDAGVIDHALTCAWPKDRIYGPVLWKPGDPGHNQWVRAHAGTYVDPASSSDGAADLASGYGIPMGSRIQLNPMLTDEDFKSMGIDSYYLPLCRAMQKYGCYVRDSTVPPGWMTIYAESWNNSGRVHYPAGWYPASQKLLPHLRVVEPPTGTIWDDRTAFDQPHR